MSNSFAEVIDFDSYFTGRWQSSEIRKRYHDYAHHRSLHANQLRCKEHVEGARRWIYPLISTTVDEIEEGDLACADIGIEFIEEDQKFFYGRVLKAKTARALRRSKLLLDQKERIRRRVMQMLHDSHIPHEYRDYARRHP